MLQFENRIVRQRICFEPVQNFEKPNTANPFAKKPAEHAVLSPHVPFVCGNMLNNIVSGRAKNIFGGVGLLFGNSRGPNIGLEEFHGIRDLVHQACERRSHQRNPKSAQQLKQRSGRPHNRVGVRGDEIVDSQCRCWRQVWRAAVAGSGKKSTLRGELVGARQRWRRSGDQARPDGGTDW